MYVLSCYGARACILIMMIAWEHRGVCECAAASQSCATPIGRSNLTCFTIL